jgi:hypothetical protein
MTTKLKIDVSQGILEVEGSEAFVRAIYRDFKVQFLGEEAAGEEVQPTRRRRTRQNRQVKTVAKPSPQPHQAAEIAKISEPTGARIEPEPTPDSEKPLPTPSYTFLKDLDLVATEDHPSLVEFMDSKFPITNEERNLVFIYYLQYMVKQKPITVDHIYTCYRKANIRAPLDLQHSLKMTAKDRKWIRIAKNGNITTLAAGKQYLEKQLPKKMKS